MVERPLNLILLILVVAASLRAQAPGKGVKEPTGSIAGRVMIGPDPVSGVKVLLNRQNYGRSKLPVAKGTTDSDGRYLLTGVPAGNYRITVLAPGYVSPKVATGGRGEPLSLTDGEKLSNVDFALTRGGAITGQVTDSDGQPVIQEEVILCPVGEAYPQGSSIRRVFASLTHSKQSGSLYAAGVGQGYAGVIPIRGSTPLIAYAVINDGSQPGERTGDGAFISSWP